MNKVFISGRLTRDVEKKTSASGAEFAKFSVAVDKFGKDKQKKTIFVDCVAFAHNANYVAKYCGKGSKVYIEGELDSNTVDREDGGKTTYWSVVVFAMEANKPEQSNTAPAPAPEETQSNMPFEV